MKKERTNKAAVPATVDAAAKVLAAFLRNDPEVTAAQAAAARETLGAFVSDYERTTTAAVKRQGEMGARVSAILNLLRAERGPIEG